MEKPSVYDDKILRDFATPGVNKGAVFHSSVYGEAQAGATVGSGGVEGKNVQQRQELDENRKYVRNYRDAKLMTGLYAQRKVASVSAGVTSAAGAATGKTADAAKEAAAAAQAAKKQATQAAVSGYEARLNTHVSKQGYGQDCRRNVDKSDSNVRGFGQGATRPSAGGAPSGGTTSRFQVKPNIKPSW